jgi:hypothetical protein
MLQDFGVQDNHMAEPSIAMDAKHRSHPRLPHIHNLLQLTAYLIDQL